MQTKTLVQVMALGLFLSLAPAAFAARYAFSGSMLSVPDEWQVVQARRWQENAILVLGRGLERVHLFERPAGDVAIDFAGAPSFGYQIGDKYFYGYADGATRERAESALEEILGNFEPLTPAQNELQDGSSRSLTGDDFRGKKWYLGWGAAASHDPSMMHNEVKYDVLHTHDVFTAAVGGGYLGTKLIGSNVQGSQIRSEWKKLGFKMTAEDMYLQYSSGHGSESGLAVGLSYTEIRDKLLSFPAREVVVFMMACRSGNLVNAFNSKKALWENWPSLGRTLFVMTSSAAGVDSATGPGTDPKEPGPNGSAGSAFGHALWKALIGDADGADSGQKDGFLSLAEIQKYAIKRTKEIGGHTPVLTGAYDPGLIMAKVPSREWVEKLGPSTLGLSDEEIRDRIQQLDN